VLLSVIIVVNHLLYINALLSLIQVILLRIASL
jgi:hypothetical protein